jgi:hypothetical protein
MITISISTAMANAAHATATPTTLGANAAQGLHSGFA